MKPQTTTDPKHTPTPEYGDAKPITLESFLLHAESVTKLRRCDIDRLKAEHAALVAVVEAAKEAKSMLSALIAAHEAAGNEKEFANWVSDFIKQATDARNNAKEALATLAAVQGGGQ